MIPNETIRVPERSALTRTPGRGIVSFVWLNSPVKVIQVGLHGTHGKVSKTIFVLCRRIGSAISGGR